MNHYDLQAAYKKAFKDLAGEKIPIYGQEVLRQRAKLVSLWHALRHSPTANPFLPVTINAAKF